MSEKRESRAEPQWNGFVKVTKDWDFPDVAAEHAANAEGVEVGDIIVARNRVTGEVVEFVARLSVGPYITAAPMEHYEHPDAEAAVGEVKP